MRGQLLSLLSLRGLLPLGLLLKPLLLSLLVLLLLLLLRWLLRRPLELVLVLPPKHRAALVQHLAQARRPLGLGHVEWLLPVGGAALLKLTETERGRLLALLHLALLLLFLRGAIKLP